MIFSSSGPSQGMTIFICHKIHRPATTVLMSTQSESPSPPESPAQNPVSPIRTRTPRNITRDFPTNATYIILDIETTGLVEINPKDIASSYIPAPIQIGLLFADRNFKVLHEFVWYMYTYKRISNGAYGVHGISRTDLKYQVTSQYFAHAKCYRANLEVPYRNAIVTAQENNSRHAREIAEFLLNHDYYVCGHSLGFHWGILANAVGPKFFFENSMHRLAHPVCTLRYEACRKFHPDTFSSFWLSSLDRLLRLNRLPARSGSTHDAQADCRCVLSIIQRLRKRYINTGNLLITWEQTLDSCDDEKLKKIRDDAPLDTPPIVSSIGRKRKCRGITRDGRSCKSKPLVNHKYCLHHT